MVLIDSTVVRSGVFLPAIEDQPGFTAIHAQAAAQGVHVDERNGKLFHHKGSKDAPNDAVKLVNSLAKKGSAQDDVGSQLRIGGEARAVSAARQGVMKFASSKGISEYIPRDGELALHTDRVGSTKSKVTRLQQAGLYIADVAEGDAGREGLKCMDVPTSIAQALRAMRNREAEEMAEKASESEASSVTIAGGQGDSSSGEQQQGVKLPWVNP